MVTTSLVTDDWLLAILVLWATTGLTIIHLGVLAVRYVARWFQRTTARLAPEHPSGPRPTLTFLVPVYNDGMTIGPTIESILRQSVQPDRILVVDDGSTDETPRVLESYRAQGVDVIRLEMNVGKPHALDAALARVDTDLVAITDADSIVHVDYVKEMLRCFADPELAAAGGAVESIPHTWVTAARQVEYMLTIHVDRDAETTMNALVVLPGVSTTYRTSVLKEMGFEFDTIAEDFDMTFRLQKAGMKIQMNLRAKVYTSDPPTLRSYYRQLVRWYTDFWLVLKKHSSVLGKRVFGTVEVPMLVMNATISSVLFLLLPVYLLATRPEGLILFFASAFVVDAALVVITWRAYKRNDVWWALASRIPTRFVSRYAFIYAMTRVLVGRPGTAWDKLERRETAAFLAKTARTLPRTRAPTPASASIGAASARPLADRATPADEPRARKPARKAVFSMMARAPRAPPVTRAPASRETPPAARPVLLPRASPSRRRPTPFLPLPAASPAQRREAVRSVKVTRSAMFSKV